MNPQLTLYTYWRSSAAYRVRIALNLKQLPYESRYVNLVADGGEQKQDAYAALNPQKLVPTLVDGAQVITQSLAIIEYLEECYPDVPLIPATPSARARVRALAQLIACDIHPLNNLRVLQYLGRDLKLDKADADEWYRHWVREGFAALEAQLSRSAQTGTYCQGETPTLADITLVPQMFNARRFQVDLTPYPTLVRIEEACNRLPAFIAAEPSRQGDAV